MKHFKILMLVLGFTAFTAGCGSLFGASEDEESSSDSDTATETDEESMMSAAVEALNSSTTGSESASSASISALSTDTSSLATASLVKRFRCDDSSSVDETFSCDNDDGSVDRVVTFDGCDLEYSPRDAVLNGGFTNTIENGGDGLCEASDTIDFAHMVMGRDGLDAVHTHQIDEDAGMVFTWGNSIGDHTVTVNGLHTETFSDAVDGDNDGAAESVTVTLEKSISRVHEIDGEVENEVTVFTSDDDFEAEDSDGNPITVEVSLPVHEVTIDEDTGLPEGRTIVSGNLIVDNESDSLRMIFSVDDEGLSFDDGSTCGPVDGTITIVGYTIEDDGTIGAEVGTGEVVFEDGEVQSATFDGITLEPQPRPCS